MTFPEHGAATRATSSAARSSCSRRTGIPLPVVSGGGTPALLTLADYPDDDRASRRHLCLQRRDDGAFGRRHLGRLRHACARHRGQPADRGSRHHRCRLEGADPRAVLRQEFRPRRRISRRGRRQPLGGARHDRPLALGERSRRSARSSTSSPTIAASSPTWSTRSSACATARSRWSGRSRRAARCGEVGPGAAVQRSDKLARCRHEQVKQFLLARLRTYRPGR